MTISVGPWVEVQASETVANGAMSVGPPSQISTAHSHLVEFRLQVTGTPSSAGPVHLYRRRRDGTYDSPVPTPAYRHEYVGTFNLSTTADDYFCGPISNFDPNDHFYWFNDTGSTITATLYGRTKEYT